MREEADTGLKWRQMHGRGGTGIGVARARDISNGKHIPLDTVKRMHSYFSRHAVDMDAPANSNTSDPGYPGAGLIAWKLWGGNAGRSWAKAIIDGVDDDKPVTASAAPETSADDDNQFERYGVHHTSNGRWPHRNDEFYDASQPRAKNGKWTLYGAGSVAPSSRAVATREGYMKGTPKVDAVDYAAVRVPTGLRNRAANLYAKMPMDDPAVHHAWNSLRDEVKAQYDYITKVMGIKVEVVKNDPYTSVQGLIDDIDKNKRIKVMSTATTGSHSLFTDAENDMFRAVHDFFGHAATGRDFSRHGERATYLAHAATMRSRDSIRALFTETEMQNAYLIKNKEFGPQKVGLAPDSMVFNGVHTNAEELGIVYDFWGALDELDSVVMDNVTAGSKLNVRLSTGEVIELAAGQDRTKAMQAARRKSPESVGKGRDPSLRWPWLFDVLKAKGYDDAKAAAIANSRVGLRKKGRLNVLTWKQAEKPSAVRKAMKPSDRS
jgi:hypothetical protein